MIHLNTLAFVSVPKHSALSRTQIRRQRMIECLGEQRRLVADPAYAPVVRSDSRNECRDPAGLGRKVRVLALCALPHILS